MLLSFSVSLWFFNHGNVFAAMPLVYPGLVVAARPLPLDRAARPRARAASRRLAGLGARRRRRCSCSASGSASTSRDSNVIDVGYSGVIGADRIWHGQSPYGHFPIEDDRPKCGPAGRRRARCATASRRTAAASRRTPSATRTARSPTRRICPATGRSAGAGSGTRCRRCTRPRSSGTCSASLGLAPRRAGGSAGLDSAATLAFAWAAWPFSQYVSSSNTNDAIQPALLVWGFFFATSPGCAAGSPRCRPGRSSRRCCVLPLWSGYPDARRVRPAAVVRRRVRGRDGARVLRRSCSSPRRWHAAGVFFHRTFGYQFGRDSPFSLWDWRQYHARGLPDLHWVQRALAGAAPRRGARARPLAAPPLAAPARGVHGRAARRLRARADPLVLPLPAVVLPLRRVRAARAGAPADGARQRPSG